MSAVRQFFVDRGRSRPAGSNQPFALRDSSLAWYVENGPVDVFLAPFKDGVPAGSRRHFFQAQSGDFLMGLPARPAAAVELVAVGRKEARIYEMPLACLQQYAGDPALAPAIARGVDRWIAALGEGLHNGAVAERTELLQPGDEIELEPGAGVAPAGQGVLWLKIKRGRLGWSDEEACCWDASPLPAPLVGTSLGQALAPTSLCALDTVALLQDGLLWASLEAFQARLEPWAQLKLSRLAAEEARRLELKSSAQRAARTRAVGQLARLLARAPEQIASIEEGNRDPLFRACQMVGQALGAPIKPHPDSRRSGVSRDPLGAIAKASRIRVRRVLLTEEWWRQDNGPMLAFWQQDRRPAALLPVGSTRYEVADPADGKRQPVTAEVARQLDPSAFTFYRPFPNRALKARDLVQFGFQNCGRDAGMVLGLGLLGGLLGMLFPIVTGILFDSVIPNAGGLSQLSYLILALLMASFASMVFEITRGIAVLRMETRGNVVVESALWDRLLSLPMTFFRNYTVGDLNMRANGINEIRATLSNAVMGSMLSAMFSVFNFGLLFFYSGKLALVAVGLLALNVAATAAVSAISLRYQRPLFELQGKISGMVLQFITGITKLRVANAEAHAYAVWAKAFADQKDLDLILGKIFLGLRVFNDAFPMITSMCLFAGMALWTQNGLSTGKFLAFNAAFGSFLGSMLALSSSFISLLHALPIYERAQPILEVLPEVVESKSDPGELRGRIEASHVCFRYKADGPLVLNDVSFQINPGEFIAVVGPSGSGKTSLFRLLLGFEAPGSGTICYEGRDLAGLDVHAVRRQCGVVMQNGKLMPGDIFRNIVGSSPLTLEDAWEAARQAGLDEDIDQMPMGMHTVLSEGASMISGGQRQRLMIARAIVNRPRILLFDEATSALDNRTQAIVSRSLERLQATRIVIAHRLSTILHADRILVLQKGRLAQSGSYEELAAQPGPFAELAQRQIA